MRRIRSVTRIGGQVPNSETGESGTCPRFPEKSEPVPVSKRRFIVHVDIDAFFAAVEVLLNPSLAGKPLIVGGLPHERGVASTCSYEARRYGVHSGMALRNAYKLCPQGVFVRGNYQVYQSFSDNFFRILHDYTPDVEEASIDEAYLDFTRCRPLYPLVLRGGPGDQGPGRARDRAQGLGRRRPEQDPGQAGHQPGQAGRLSSRSSPGGEEEFLRDLPIDSLPGIGPKTQVLLRMLNIQKIGDLWGLPRPTLHSHLRPGRRRDLPPVARHRQPAPGHATADPKSVSRETTFLEDLWDSRLLLAHLAYLCDRLTLALRRGPAATPTSSRSRPATPTSGPRSAAASSSPRARRWATSTGSPRSFSCRSSHGRGCALRLVGVKASDLIRVRPLSLFEP